MATITSLASTDNWATSRTTINTNFTNVNTEVETASTDIDTLQGLTADATATTKWISKASVAPVSAATPIFVWDNDPRVPSQNENDAISWYSWNPVSSSNKLIDFADTATTATADKVVRRIAAGQITVPTTPSAATDAASKSYVDLMGSLSINAVQKIYVDVTPSWTSIGTWPDTLYTMSIPANTFTANSEMIVEVDFTLWSASSGDWTITIKLWWATVYTTGAIGLTWSTIWTKIKMCAIFDATTWVCNVTTSKYTQTWVATTYTRNVSTVALTSDRAFLIEGSRTGSGGSFDYYSSSMLKI